MNHWEKLIDEVCGSSWGRSGSLQRNFPKLPIEVTAANEESVCLLSKEKLIRSETHMAAEREKEE